MKRTHDKVTEKAPREGDEDADSECESSSSSSFAPGDPHPKMTLVPLNPAHTYIYFHYMALESPDGEHPRALLDTSSLSANSLKVLLALLKRDEELAKYVVCWVDDEGGLADEIESVLSDPASAKELCGEWSQVPDENAGVTVQVASFVLVNGCY
jgi:hypothetical protein